MVVENDGFEINVENDILATFKFLLNLGVVLVDFIDSISLFSSFLLLLFMILFRN